MAEFIPDEIKRVHPTRMVFGEGVAKQAGDAVREFGRKPLVVIGSSFARRTGALEMIENSLKEAGLRWAVHEGVHADPTLEDVVSIVWAIRDGLHDSVIALGGGSVLDASKIAARDVRNKPLVAIPTTAGSGSEVTKHAFLVDSEKGRKFPKSDMALLARVALIDPELTYTCPPELTADAGLDAITHHLEGYFNQRDRQKSNPIALEGLPIAMKHLKRAWENGQDREARREMMKSSMMAGVVIHFKPTGLPHGFSYSMYEQAAHGAAVAILLPYCWAYYASAIGEKSIHAAKALGADVEGLSEKQAAKAGIEILIDLYKSLNRPTALKELKGMDRDKLVHAATALANDFDKLQASPRRPDRERELADMMCIAEAAWEGDFEALLDF